MSSLSHAQERRLTVRLLSYWEKLRRDRPMPGEQDLDPEHIKDLWGHCFLVHLKDVDKPGYHYTYLGPEIRSAYTGGLPDEEVGELISPNAAKLTECYKEIRQSRKPLIDEGEFRNARGDLVRYRQCLLPLGSGAEVDAVFGAMRYRVFAAK